MLAYKGFNKDLTCLGYQFKPGKNITKEANCIKNGFHCAENPLDCLSYYQNWDKSVYYQVDAGGDLDEDGRDSKISCTELTLLRKLSMLDFVTAAVEYMWKYPNRETEYVSHGKIRVCKDWGLAGTGEAVIVRGADPRAAGQMGSIIALVKDGLDGIESAAIRRIDGKKYTAGKWYTI